MDTAIMNTYPDRSLAFARGEGAYLFTAEGRRYLDFMSGIGVTALGHAHPQLVAALSAQAEKLWHCSNVFRVPDQDRLAARLVAHSFADKVFFCNSGVEAFEAAVKLARRYHYVGGNPKRFQIICLEGAFHGRSLAAIAAGGNPKYLEGFDPITPGFLQVPFGNMNALRDRIDDTTAAILVEPVQGEGGLRAADPAFLAELRRACDEWGLLLIFDEVQCGLGRTGKLFAHEWAGGVFPDIMMLAKGLGGGFPVGALLARDEVAAAFTPGSHGTTFGGNPLAMAACNAVLDVLLAPDFLPAVRASAERLRAGLTELIARFPQVFSELRGQGLMLGLLAVPPNQDLILRLREEGLLVVGAAGNVVRLLPPLIIGKKEVEEALAILEAVALSYQEATA